MRAITPRPIRTLALHPVFNGLGWTVFEAPLTPHDWGTFDARGDKNAQCLIRVAQLLTQFLPEILVLEAFERDTSQRKDRVARLCRAIVALATDRGVDVAIYTRGDVQACFVQVGARTRDEIAAAVARHIPAFEKLLPPRRKAWESPHRHMAVFAAAALALTHYQLSLPHLLNDLFDHP